MQTNIDYSSVSKGANCKFFKNLTIDGKLNRKLSSEKVFSWTENY